MPNIPKMPNSFLNADRQPVTSRGQDLRTVQICLLIGHVLTVFVGLRSLITLPLTEKELLVGTFLLISLNGPLVAAGAALELLIRAKTAHVDRG